MEHYIQETVMSVQIVREKFCVYWKKKHATKYLESSRSIWNTESSFFIKTYDRVFDLNQAINHFKHSPLFFGRWSEIY